MVNHAIWSLIVIFLGIVFIIISTSKVKLHTFFVLIIASYLVGLLSGMPLNDIVESISKGFGDTLSSIGIVIAAGAVIGVFLERSNGALSISQALLRVFRKSRSPLSMAITGYLVSIAVFCDSGFVILSPLNKALAKETKI
ncbi:MAG TPA: GntP family permease, partial [Candidatus Atribacteria bacterium]|nr:GntP family permease [Candidatus Atribacteria bacterium]